MSGRSRGRAQKEKMPWGKALLLDVLFSAAAVGVTFVYARMWIQHRTERSWPVVMGTVTERTNGRGSGGKGRPYTYLVGHYDLGVRHRFSVGWAPSDIKDAAWVPPDGTPPVGSQVLLHADPNDPSRVALDANPRKRFTAYDVALFALMLFLCIVGAIAVWFI